MGRKRRLKLLNTQRNSIAADRTQRIKIEMSNFWEMRARQRLGDGPEMSKDDKFLKMAYESQGDHEAGILQEDGMELTATSCQKNPGHVCYFEASKFAKDNIPKPYNTNDIFACISELIFLTVKLIIKGTSGARPDNYDFANSRLTRCGSGSIYIPDPEKRTRDDNCPCKKCKNYQNRTTDFGYIWVTTAKHVIYNDEEAQRTKVWLNYDDVAKENVSKLHGHRLVVDNEEADRCILECVTHDLSLCGKINQARDRVKDFERQFSKEFGDSEAPPLATLISHPHGMPKRIGFGKDVKREFVKAENEDVEWTTYTYDAPTCTGSSGALVWLLGHERVGFKDNKITTHTHAKKEGLRNKSGRGLDYVKKC
ncbi:unnamed protein product [Lymnaea stagnalis]|uniref:Uncharacterized protein n=1 Tax=Lymnaea stagnalis TaxID=6523 RepID=A0AAV2HV99_LYMST